MSAFVFAVDGSHLSIKHKNSDLFCDERYSAQGFRFFSGESVNIDGR